MSGARLIFRGLVVFLALSCAVGLARIAATTFLHVPLDPNEGWNAYRAVAATSGGALYPPSGSFVFNNYPPLSFYIVGAFGSLTGDNIVAGRILSFLATLCIAGMIYALLRGMNADLWRALFAALLFVSGLLVFTNYVGMDDPQLLAHTVAIGGLALLLGRPSTAGVVATAALLMTAALFMKHNLIALPVAVTFWLASYSRRDATCFAVSGVLFSLVGLTIFHWIYSVGLIGQLNSPRLWSVDTLAGNLANFMVWADVSLFGLAALVFIGPGDKRIAFCAIYAIVSVAVGAAFAGGAGVDMNIWFDAAIALALGGALLLQRLSSSTWLTAAAAIAYTIPLLAGLALSWNSDWSARAYWLHPMAGESDGAAADIAFLRSHEGPALCEMLSLCYWAEKREEVDVFNLGQAYATYARSDAELVRLLDARYFHVIEFDSLEDFALTPRVKLVLLRDYRVDHASDNGVFLVPR